MRAGDDMHVAFAGDALEVTLPPSSAPAVAAWSKLHRAGARVIIFDRSRWHAIGERAASALPSLHAGWALIVALGVILASTSRWRWLILAHPFLTIVVIAATANHWWLDSVAAAVVLAAVVGVQRVLDRARAGRVVGDAEAELDAALEPAPAPA